MMRSQRSNSPIFQQEPSSSAEFTDDDNDDDEDEEKSDRSDTQLSVGSDDGICVYFENNRKNRRWFN
uniref:Uncharacterized protein n=1 Tax=Glossina morsitans morsitans TaxID=37546 RepID=A0A1B0FBK2_GLOMM